MSKKLEESVATDSSAEVVESTALLVQQWIWIVSVAWQDWEEQVYTDESEAYACLQKYFEDRECDGCVDIDPTFRKLRVRDFRWICPDHATTLIEKDGKSNFCQRCQDDGYDGFIDTFEAAYQRVKEADFLD